MNSKPQVPTSSSSNPINIFSKWYPELCRRYNTHPLSVIKFVKNKDHTVLDFVADRIKYEDWIPILNALRTDTSLRVISIKSHAKNVTFKHDAKNECTTKQLRKSFPVIWTTYILTSLVTCLGACLKQSEALNVVELEGIAIPLEILDTLLNNLRVSRSIQTLSLKGCQLNDLGCKIVCTNLRLMPNIKVIDMSWCNLTMTSGEYIATIIKHQQIEREAESWCNLVSYDDYEVRNANGIRRITLNNNPDMGDAGLAPILKVLVNDLYVKAIDMQNCNITDEMAPRILNLVKKNKILEVADFRYNKSMSLNALTTVLEAFEDKYYKRPFDPEFKWTKNETNLYVDSTDSHQSAPIGRAKSETIRKTKSEIRTRSLSRERPERLETKYVTDACATQKQLANRPHAESVYERPWGEPIEELTGPSGDLAIEDLTEVMQVAEKQSPPIQPLIWMSPDGDQARPKSPEPDRSLGAIPKKRMPPKPSSRKSREDPCCSTGDLLSQLSLMDMIAFETEQQCQKPLLQYYCQSESSDEEFASGI